MVELDQMKLELMQYKDTLKEVRDSLDIENKKKRIEELDMEMASPDFWSDPERANKRSKDAKNMKDTVETCDHLAQAFEDIQTLIEIGNEENDTSMIEEVRSELDDFINKLDVIRLQTLLTGEYDANNAIMRINAGAGGTESCDWASILYRMYSHWVDKKGFSLELLDMQDGDEAGIKSVDFQVNGENAYGYLKSEQGVHRLVRISPFNAQGKRQTSFVSVDVVPELTDDAGIEINPDDLRIDTYRSSGAGGQHINKTSSAIRITHIPTGIVVQCQNERSQFQNKDKAMEMLRGKLLVLKQAEEEAKMKGIQGDLKSIEWGSQIRSYFLQPYQLVNDHRTGEKVSNADAVLDGDIDRFINAYLKKKSQGTLLEGGAEDDSDI
ncbi:MAG: peptide chain release factor 2 [Lachnospiraceae bacterium]|nr:peptide chain release factor 2 [Lachnospiraceae bacterium]MBO6298270.1 peptide chain release factor 2 [Lachnospiraceae bacterium]MBP3297400.1 peptide chain release factor 2 [Lachnospiraceae bacterium]